MGERRTPEEHRGGGKEARTPHLQFSPHLAQHQGYMPYVHGPYAYSHGYEPNHPGYRGMPSVMMQNYPGRTDRRSLPRLQIITVQELNCSYYYVVHVSECVTDICMSSGSYLPAGYSFPSYGGKVPGGEEGEKPSRSSPTMKPPSEAKALELLQQHASQYKSKSPSIPDNKTPHERERDRDRERERLLPSHHHLGYPLLSAQYDLSYTSGETRPCEHDGHRHEVS